MVPLEILAEVKGQICIDRWRILPSHRRLRHPRSPWRFITAPSQIYKQNKTYQLEIAKVKPEKRKTKRGRPVVMVRRWIHESIVTEKEIEWKKKDQTKESGKEKKRRRKKHKRILIWTLHNFNLMVKIINPRNSFLLVEKREVRRKEKIKK